MKILEVKNLSVKYSGGSLRDTGLKEYILTRGRERVKEFYANRDVNFSLERGDMLGVIGTNGAGKSTLLKAISGILPASEGEVICRGKIAALLELGSGFDGDLTVKENAYLRGALLGYSRKFMDEVYPDIIEFAELSGVEDRAFKRLSSGMKSRLGFAISSFVEPDILILDEVLSVGDGAFRKKSEEKMRSIIKSGATSILVSHSSVQIKNNSNKILWLDRGRQITFGDDVEKILFAYEEFLKTKRLPTEI